MQLDRTQLAIRQRSTSELFDLTLIVLRRHARPILASMALLGFPVLAIDLWMTAGMLSQEAVLASESASWPEFTVRVRYGAHLVALFYLQFQIISLPTTIVLGHLVFFEEMSTRRLIAQLRQGFLEWMAILGLVRLGLAGWLIEGAISHQAGFDAGIEFWFFFLLVPIAVWIRAARPFAPEILGLEKCHWRATANAPVSYRARSANLHRFMVGENFLRHVACGGATATIALSLGGTLMFVQGTATGDWSWNAWWDFALLPGVLWCVGLFAAVFRFLSYLDCRIRMEGWEIELLMRAEGERQRAASIPPTSGGTLVEERVIG